MCSRPEILKRKLLRYASSQMNRIVFGLCIVQSHLYQRTRLSIQFTGFYFKK